MKQNVTPVLMACLLINVFISRYNALTSISFTFSILLFSCNVTYLRSKLVAEVKFEVMLTDFVKDY